MSVSTFAAAQLIRALPRVPLSRAVGRLCDQPLPGPVSALVQRAYCAAFGVDLGEARDPGPYPSFDAFFTRRLRDGARPVAAAPLVSPADGVLSAVGSVVSETGIVVKGQTYDVAELLGDPAAAREYASGSYFVVYLSPRDYHRVHAPVGGKVSLVRGIPGDLYPVNAIGEKYVPGLFVRNNRVAVFIDTLELGRVAVVLVGATIVGRISVTLVPEPAVPAGDTVPQGETSIQRGDELGMFHLGSTVVVLLPEGVAWGRSVGAVRMGEGLVSAS